MRALTTVLLLAVFVTPLPAQTDRYGSPAGGSSNDFSKMFADESRSSPRQPAPPTATQPKASSSAELRPLRGSAPKPSTASPAADDRSGRYNAAQRGSGSSTYRPRASSTRSLPGAERSITRSNRREDAAHAMLKDMLRAPANSRLSGTSTTLQSAVARAATREEQGRIVEAYWALSSSATDYYLGLGEAEELGRLRQRVPTYSKSLSEALVDLNTRIDTSLKAAQAAQMRLATLMGGGARPLPTDVPFCGPYLTRFGENFGTGAPAEARLLNDLLPARLAELYAAADGVDRSNEWLKKVAQAGAGGDGAGVIRALELVALNRRAFVMLARDYNLQINRYTQLTTPNERVDTGRLVAMLIRTDGAARSSRSLAGGGGLEFQAGAASRR